MNLYDLRTPGPNVKKILSSRKARFDVVRYQLVNFFVAGKGEPLIEFFRLVGSFKVWTDLEPDFFDYDWGNSDNLDMIECIEFDGIIVDEVKTCFPQMGLAFSGE